MQIEERKGILPISGTIGDLHTEMGTEEDSTLMTDKENREKKREEDTIAEGKGKTS